MKSIRMSAAAFAAVMTAAAWSPAFAAASTCSQACSASYNQCTSRGGSQPACMTTWGQCRNTCNGVATVKPVVQSKPTAVPTKPVVKTVARN